MHTRKNVSKDIIKKCYRVDEDMSAVKNEIANISVVTLSTVYSLFSEEHLSV